jgi:hypothetical protein
MPFFPGELAANPRRWQIETSFSLFELLSAEFFGGVL